MLFCLFWSKYVINNREKLHFLYHYWVKCSPIRLKKKPNPLLNYKKAFSEIALKMFELLKSLAAKLPKIKKAVFVCYSFKHPSKISNLPAVFFMGLSKRWYYLKLMFKVLQNFKLILSKSNQYSPRNRPTWPYGPEKTTFKKIATIPNQYSKVWTCSRDGVCSTPCWVRPQPITEA